jgi:septal ring factor EnvC (AmiA/AmiB activator)
MYRPLHCVRALAVGAVLGLLIMNGCTKRPSEQELQKLEEARMAAESAESKLADLKNERAQLEKSLEDKQTELRQHEAERDDLKQKMGK